MLHKASVAAKLREQGMLEEADALDACHASQSYIVCRGCRKSTLIHNHCDRSYCPACLPALSRARYEALRWWTQFVREPKHVVLTVANTVDMTPDHLRQFKRWITMLRHRKVCRGIRSGCWSIECTWSATGWHLHAHLLIDGPYIPQPALALAWESVTAGAGRIVHIKSCRDTDYLKEVAKYSVKGTSLAAWPAQVVATWVKAIAGNRTFAVFGALLGRRADYAAAMSVLLDERRTCPCGCRDLRIMSPAEHDWWLATGMWPRPPTRRATA